MRLISVFALFASVCAVDVVGHVEWNELCPDVDALGPARVLLDAGRRSARVTRSGDFEIPDVDPGTYVLSVLSHDHLFDQLRVTVPDSSSSPSSSAIPQVDSHVFGTPLLSPGAVALSYPVVLTPRSKNNYFKPHDSFNLLGMLRNPMIMMMAVTGAMMLAMPYIMKSLDPETLDEIKTQQAKMVGIQSSMNSADIKSGLTTLLPDETKPSTPPPSAHQRKSGRGAKRR